MEKKKLLFWGDSPTCATGFATVSRNILRCLQDTGNYEITIVGINHAGQPHLFPYAIYPAVNPLSGDPRYKNVFGFQQFVDFCGTGAFDIVFIIQDTFIVKHLMPALEQTWNNLPEAKRFSLVYYFPIDATPKRSWVEDVVAKVQFPVAYTNYAKDECVKICPSLSKMPVIYHGVNKKEFYPVDKKKARKEFFVEHADKFIVTNISRNQPRKDLIRTFAAFSVFHEQTPKSFLFVLAQAEDVGGNLIEMAENYGLVFGKDWACPSPKTYNANQGYDVETVNKIYNASDLIVSTTLGEGFGLSTVEAMATKTPILMPNNTALVEIIGKHQERGWFCESGLNLNFHVCLGANDNNLLRPVVDVYNMADQMSYICEHYEEAEAKAEAAFEWAQSWEEVCEDWIKIFKKAWTVPKKFKVQ